MYRPDKFVVLKITNKDGSHYRIFGSWHGGYLDGDSWRLNSGITNVTKTKNGLNFQGQSGSVYRVNPEQYGMTIYTSGVLRSWQEDYKDKGVTLEVLDNQDWTKFEF